MNVASHSLDGGTYMSARRLSIIAATLTSFAFASAGLASAQQAGASKDAERKAAILNSECWRRAIFERDQWLRTQTVFPPEQVPQLRADFAARVDAMSADELEQVLKDLETKFRLLDTPEAREIRAWFGQYLAVLAERRRADVTKEIPDLATMTPAQLTDVLMKIQRKQSSQAGFNRGRQAQVNAQLQANRAAQQARAAAATRPAYRSPYRPAPAPRRPFDDAPQRRRSMTVDPNGGVWMNLAF
jgi:hypothetical protein